MNNSQISTFLLHCKERRTVRGTRWLILSAAHLFFHDMNHFFTSGLWQPNRFSLPWLMWNSPYHVVRIIHLTKGTAFQVCKSYSTLILKQDVNQKLCFSFCQESHGDLGDNQQDSFLSQSSHESQVFHSLRRHREL